MTFDEHHDHTVFAHVPCVRCGALGSLVLFQRLEALPLATWSLAGAQLKTSARPWPYVRCDATRGGCGAECRGRWES
jgi:hypothetical protein